MRKPHVSAAALANQGWDIWFTQGGGWVYKQSSPVADKIRKLLEQKSLQSENRMMPIWEESGVFNFSFYMGAKSKIEEANLQKDCYKAQDGSGRRSTSAPAGFPGRRRSKL